jgi:hypothetical protein
MASYGMINISCIMKTGNEAIMRSEFGNLRGYNAGIADGWNL